jgi:superfamily I DNA/RNA helicase
VGEGDLVLCRLTAPLVSACLALIAQGVPARVRGREIGAGLVSVVRQIEKHDQYRWEDFDKLLGEWTNWKVAQLRRREGTEDAVQATEDKASAIRAVFLSKPFRNAMDLILAIEKLFSNDSASVWLSTVHRAKGLEADRVFILRPKKLPLEWATQQEWQRDQELNLKYVALTRARKSLIFCEEIPGATEKT